MIRPDVRLALGLCTATLLSAGSARAHLANHLVISELGIDTVAESSQTASSEFVEIFNPTNGPITLNAGATPGTLSASPQPSYFLADIVRDYIRTPQGKVAISTNTDSVLQFPAGAVIPARGTVVVCSNAETFLTEFFAGGTLAEMYARFRARPGNPQLFEALVDGATPDEVPNMLIQSTYTSGAASAALNLTNGGEVVVLFRWDGVSNLVQDVDVYTWGTGTTNVVKKLATDTIDGPDADTEATAYKADAGQSTSLGSSGSATATPQRRSIEETNEASTDGNGVTGHDETSESFSTGTAAPTSWTTAPPTPGLPLIRTDGALADALSFLAPLATSAADGPASMGTPSDYGADGTLTELYATLVDTNADRAPDSIYVAVRGHFFGEPEETFTNTPLVLLDLNPGTASGVKRLQTDGNELSDVTGTLDTRLTRANLALSSEWSSIGLDAALGVGVAPPPGAGAPLDAVGWRGFGTGGTSGSFGNLAWLGTDANVRYDAAVSAAFPGAPGTSNAAGDGFEAFISLADLGQASVPPFVFITAAVTSNAGNAASPNTLPESPLDELNATPQPINRGVCLELATGRVVTYFVDADFDGFGSTQLALYCGPLVNGVSRNSDDCDDNAVFYVDADNDGFGSTTTVLHCGALVPGVSANNTDCNDANADVNPGEVELCNGIDDNCLNGAEDETRPLHYLDSDGDGHGGSESVRACTAPPGYLSSSDDCNDANDAIYLGAPEICDGLDNDCNNLTDDGASTTFYRDQDGDTYGTGADTQATCTAPAGYVARAGDCNDANAAINPEAAEVCDGADNNCDGRNDEGVGTAYFTDQDNDGYGAGDPTFACTQPANTVTRGGDCQPTNAAINPGAAEICNAQDDNCDNAVDIDATDAFTYYEDADNDTFGNRLKALRSCSIPIGYVLDQTDCDDADAQRHPFLAEVCDDKDNDCNNIVDDGSGAKTRYYLDADGDGDGVAGTTADACAPPANYVTTGTDCDDSKANVRPGLAESCDGLDNDCDQQTDEEVTTAYYTDADADGFGTGTPVAACEPPAGTAPNALDCNDAAIAVKPGAVEACNGVDDDCTGAPDANEADADGDGQRACDGDCDDSNAAVSKGASETACSDGFDNDCDGLVDTADTVDCPVTPVEVADEGCGCASGGSSEMGFALFGAFTLLLGLRRRRLTA